MDDYQLVLNSVKQFPDQCLQAWNEAKSIDTSSIIGNIYNIVVCGMGGSRFTPLTVKYLFEDRIKEPYEICDGYNLPAYVDQDTLVILSSYSGTTEEVLACYEDAKKKGAKVAVITKGGKLAEIARNENLPAYIFEEKFNPSEQPRLGVGYMLFGHIGILKSFNILDINEAEVISAIEFMRSIDLESVSSKLSQALCGKEAFVVTAEHLKGFGNGFANQINESGKQISSFRYLSELNHHLMEGLSFPKELQKKWLFIFIDSNLYSSGIIKRIPITKEVVEKQNVATYTYKLAGKTKLEQVLEAFSLSGYTTLKLSKINGVDPKSIPWVDYFKSQLK